MMMTMMNMMITSLTKFGWRVTRIPKREDKIYLWGDFNSHPLSWSWSWWWWMWWWWWRLKLTQAPQQNHDDCKDDTYKREQNWEEKNNDEESLQRKGKIYLWRGLKQDWAHQQTYKWLRRRKKHSLVKSIGITTMHQQTYKWKVELVKSLDKLLLVY